MGQKLSKSDLEGTWKFKSWKTFYTQFHPDMEPEEDSDSWMEINEEKPTSEIMEVVFGKRSNFYNSSMRLINKIKIGTWNEAEFKISGKSKEGWWEYDEEENVIMFLVQGSDNNLYFYIKDVMDDEMIVVEKNYKTESDAFFHYLTLIKE